jgi:hypothetical protein
MADFDDLKAKADKPTVLMMDQIGENIEQTALLTAEGLRDTVWDPAEPVPIEGVPKSDLVPDIIEALRSSADALEAATSREGGSRA